MAYAGVENYLHSQNSYASIGGSTTEGDPLPPAATHEMPVAMKVSGWIKEFWAELERLKNFFVVPDKRSSNPVKSAFSLTAYFVCEWLEVKSSFKGERLGTLWGHIGKLKALFLRKGDPLYHHEAHQHELSEHMEEGPHGHPEAPSDALLTAFFIANSARGPRM
jgi:hypothetical protein